MSVPIHDSRVTPRQIADQLKRFVLVDDAPQPTSRNTISLSDAGFVLLSLKDEILVDNSRSQHFCHEFVARPLNGVEILCKVVSVLQRIITSNPSPSKISNLLSRSSTNNTNRKRKAAVAEADCIECLKIILEKSENAWRRFLGLTTGMDAVLFAVNSPQLDSKCYAVEILLLLLDKPQGFVVLMRTLTALAARNHDYIRLKLFVVQLKHGLHTKKLHIQILIVRLFNKLLTVAPSPLHRSLIRSEIMLSKFSAEYVESLINSQPLHLGGMDILADELDMWRCFRSSTIPPYGIEHDHIFGLSETESESAQGERARNGRPPSNKYPSGTTLTKGVERQRFKKQSGTSFAERSSGAGHYPEADRNPSNAFYPDRRSLSLSNRARQETSSSPLLSHENYTTDRTIPSGMRRAKSESVMTCPESVHDLSVRGDVPMTMLLRPNSSRPSSARALSRTLTSRTSSLTFSPAKQESRIRMGCSPPRAHYADLVSPRARFADLPTVEAQIPHGGFSYLFPSQPIVTSIVPKKAVTPDPQSRQSIVRTQSPPRVMLPSPTSRPDYVSSCYDQIDGNFYATESRTSSRATVVTPSLNGGIGDDVRDALSQFDYLSDYENSSLRGRKREVSYHF